MSTRKPDEVPWRDKLYTVREASAILAISPSKLYEMCDRLEIVYRRIGGSIRLAESDINQFLEECKRTKLERGKPETAKPRPPRPKLRHIKL